MTRPDLYQVVALALGLIVPIIETVAARKGGRPYLSVSALLLVIIIAMLGYADWRSQPVKETPLTTYLLQAIVPTFAVASLIDWLGRMKASWVVQVASGFVLWQILAFALIFTAFFP